MMLHLARDDKESFFLLHGETRVLNAAASTLKNQSMDSQNLSVN